MVLGWFGGGETCAHIVCRNASYINVPTGFATLTLGSSGTSLSPHCAKPGRGAGVGAGSAARR